MFCSPSTPLSRFLFEDELSKSVEDITRANKIMAKVMPKKGKDTNVLFLRDRFTASRRGRYNYSFNKIELFRGKPILASFVENWRQITSHPWILQCVEGYDLEFESEPCQLVLPSQANFSKGQRQGNDKEVLKLLEKGAIVKA